MGVNARTVSQFAAPVAPIFDIARRRVSVEVSEDADAIHLITSGIAALQSTGATLRIPQFLSYLAVPYAHLGQFDDALGAIAGSQLSLVLRLLAVLWAHLDARVLDCKPATGAGIGHE